ncbi:MAG: glycosyltransferase family A protein [Bacteroidales bacterium]
MNQPILSIIVVFYNMKREAPRTLYTLSTNYQQEVDCNQYEVIAIDNGSEEAMSKEMVQSFGSNYRFIQRAKSSSPNSAINVGVDLALGRLIMICIDGARMLTPKVIYYTLAAFRAFENPIVATIAYHLGPKLQNISMTEGYNQDAEDKLLESVDWKGNGYSLLSISSLAGSGISGWFLPLGESNCLTITKSLFTNLEGYDEKFISPGGGMVNLDFYKRACEATTPLVVLLGEGTFHQFHGGVATNIPLNQHPILIFHEEYRQLRGQDFSFPSQEPTLFGKLPKESMPFLNYSVEKLNARETN